ncbi:MAG: hypothetical protein ACP5QG_04950 [candidate division WOR-3 bacterium]
MKRIMALGVLVALSCSESEVTYPYFRYIFSSPQVNPINIRYYDGYIYFLDSGTGQIWRVDADDGGAKRVGPSGYQFDVSDAGIAVVSFQGENRLDIYDLSGDPKHSAILHGIEPMRARYGPGGDLYVAILTEGDAGPLLRVNPDSGTADTVFPLVGEEFAVGTKKAYYFSPGDGRVVACVLGDTTTTSFWTGKPGMPDVFLHDVRLDLAQDDRNLLVSPLLILDTETGIQTPLHTVPYKQGTELEGGIAWETSMEGLFFNAMKIDTSEAAGANEYNHYWAIWYYGNPE